MQAIITIVLIILLTIAGSEGPLFPWLNLLSGGCFMLIAAKYLSIKYEK